MSPHPQQTNNNGNGLEDGTLLVESNSNTNLSPMTDKSSSKISVKKQKRRVNQEERILRTRQRNRDHARKLRSRKKLQAEALQIRIGEMKADGEKLRQLVDERYTASVLLGMSQTQIASGESIQLKSSKLICGNAYTEMMTSPNWFLNGDGTDDAITTASSSVSSFHEYEDDISPLDKKSTSKKIKSQPERDRMRREKNRVHAKRTRDRKKLFLEASEKIICRMEEEAIKLREYLVGIEVLTVSAAQEWNERDRIKRNQIRSVDILDGGALINTNSNTNTNTDDNNGINNNNNNNKNINMNNNNHINDDMLLGSTDKNEEDDDGYNYNVNNDNDDMASDISNPKSLSSNNDNSMNSSDNTSNDSKQSSCDVNTSTSNGSGGNTSASNSDDGINSNDSSNNGSIDNDEEHTSSQYPRSKKQKKSNNNSNKKVDGSDNVRVDMNDLEKHILNASELEQATRSFYENAFENM